ncbi:unnamed protein product [Linum tenue]|uniref:Receptor-like serine/threonine-protein kinase n=1 Tax=Linum tenue TaxID=586396 RepID=A0AAV0JDG2_9ROSI|nr:unnamed protein product [Linum tenue]
MGRFGFFFFALFLCFSDSLANLTSSSPLFPNQTLISPNQTFELGFFAPDNSSENRYLGIRFKQTSPQAIVWVANRETPVTDSAARLIINAGGNLELQDGRRRRIWSTNVSTSAAIASLQEDGNLVLRDSSTGQNLWRSGDHSGDTLIEGSWLMFNASNPTAEPFRLNSWKSAADPSPGEFTAGFLLQTPPQAIIRRNQTTYWRSGPWDRARFTNIPDMDTDFQSSLTLLNDLDQGLVYLSLRPPRNCTYTTFVMSSSGSLELRCWDSIRGWYVRWRTPKSQCENYGSCGEFGVCERNDPLVCNCLKGFVPKSEEEWRQGNWSGGCIRRTELLCGTSNVSSTGVGFLKLSGVNVPDSSEFMRVWDNGECSRQCLNNCSCTAYSYVNGIGCLMWTEKVVDLQELEFAGQDLYLRLASTDLADGKKQSARLIVLLPTILGTLVIAALVLGLIMWRKRRVNTTKGGTDNSSAPSKRLTYVPKGYPDELDESLELPMFDLESIETATDSFNTENLLGRGGFGPVYKAKLPDGKVVAIKRLSSSSGQGADEFKNEIMLISKLQHRNLVRLVGCCIDNLEKILIYEYMPNKSLDCYLFDSTKKAELDWPKRFNIIHGIARGLLYLHRDSCLRIIHRDLKVSNILLDEKMNPKISDFGLARNFEGTQDLTSTHRVVGTLGYMSPEYLLAGMFSEKSDVFSFGVLVLEIVSGRKTTSFHYEEHHPSLLSFAWRSWDESRGVDMADQTVAESSNPSEVSRCVNVGLLCVQDHASDRPTMAGVVSMLNGETTLPQPNKPTYTFQNKTPNPAIYYPQSSSSAEKWSINDLTESIIVEGR